MNLTTQDVLKIAAAALIAVVIEELLKRYVFPRILPPAADQRGLL